MINEKRINLRQELRLRSSLGQISLKYCLTCRGPMNKFLLFYCFYVLLTNACCKNLIQGSMFEFFGI